MYELQTEIKFFQYSDTSFGVLIDGRQICFAEFTTIEECVEFLTKQMSKKVSDLLTLALTSKDGFICPYTKRSYPNLSNTLASETTQNYAATKKHIT
jgi:hypothetical protein